MRIYDITLTISSGLPVWPGDTPVSLERISRIEAGDESNITKLETSVHVGTHVDAPYHFLGDGFNTAEKLSLKMLTGRAYVLHLPDDVNEITAAVLQKVDVPPRTRRLLFRTRNSGYWARRVKEFQEGFVALSPDGAQHLVDRGIKLVGVDYLSVAPFHQSAPTHEILLRAGVIALEGLDLSEVSQGRYTLYCLPLKLAGADGAPARTILIGV